jgi:hypothetical protein
MFKNIKIKEFLLALFGCILAAMGVNDYNTSTRLKALEPAVGVQLEQQPASTPHWEVTFYVVRTDRTTGQGRPDNEYTDWIGPFTHKVAGLEKPEDQVLFNKTGLNATTDLKGETAITRVHSRQFPGDEY